MTHYSLQNIETLSAPFSRYHDLKSFALDFDDFENADHLSDFRTLCSGISSKDVLDVGCGIGHTSLLLSYWGNNVTVVEPALECCEVVELNSKRFGINVNIYQTRSEEIKAIPGEFDIVLFHASLHHADQPEESLKQCFDKVSGGGRILLISESILKCFRTKAWYSMMLENHPEKVGHYGGNEHVFFSHEYANMLRKAGFVSIELIPSVIYRRATRGLGKLTWSKRIFRIAVDGLITIGFFHFLNWMSLVQVTYVGTKPNSRL